MKKRVKKIKKTRKKLFFTGIFLALLMGILLGALIMERIQRETISEEGIEIIDFKESEVDLILPAVNSKGEGVTGLLTTKIREGSGLVLVNINEVLADYELQQSSRTATNAAKNYLDLDLRYVDVIYTIKVDAEFISGSSAGAAMAVSLISLLEGEKLGEGITITGAINEEGIIQPISGISQKAEAIKEKGMNTLIVPEQSYFRNKAEREIRCDNQEEKYEYCEIKYLIEIDSEISGVKIIRVKDLNQVLEHMIK